MEYLPLVKKITFKDRLDKLTRERINELDHKIYKLEEVRALDSITSTPSFHLKEMILFHRNTLTLNIRLRILYGLPRIER